MGIELLTGMNEADEMEEKYGFLQDQLGEQEDLLASSSDFEDGALSLSEEQTQTPLPVCIFLVSLFFPTDFSVTLGGLRLSPFRVVLILFFIPILIRFASGKAGRILLSDFFILFYAIWCFVVLSYHHGIGVGLESGGVAALEVLGAYGIARAYITSQAHFRGANRLLTFGVLLLAPITIFESLNGFHVVRELSSAIMGFSFSSSIEPRYGLHRAFGPFDHPILYGVFAASLLSYSLYEALFASRTVRFCLSPLIGIAAMTSVSSGAFATLLVQLLLAAWDHATRRIPMRWWILVMALTCVYVGIDLASNRSALKVFLTYLTMSPGTAYGRTIIFDWGMKNVWANPILGIGFNDWFRPAWMISGSMDNFWLYQAVTYGIPGFLLLFGATALMLTKSSSESAKSGSLRMAWTLSMTAMIVAGCTVHFWNSLLVYFLFQLGSGACHMETGKRAEMDNYEEEHANYI